MLSTSDDHEQNAEFNRKTTCIHLGKTQIFPKTLSPEAYSKDNNKIKMLNYLDHN